MDFKIGQIINTHGVQGHVKVFPLTYAPERFELLKKINVIQGNSVTEYEITGVRFHKQLVILKLKGIDNMNEAERLKNSYITIPEELALPLEEDEFYMRDLYDCQVFTEDGEKLGILTDILQTGANDVYSVTDDDGKTLLIPAIKQCILSINASEKKIIVKLLEGLRS